MRIIVAPDSFKGSLSSARIIEIVRKEAVRAFPGAQVMGLPVADGGEGTVDALLACRGGERVFARVTGPLFEPADSFYGVLPTGEVVIESAAACGLPMIPLEKRNPMLATSYGLGEMIADALGRGMRKIYIGLGGTATVDGGLGALSALGVRFLGADRQPVRPVGEGIAKVRSIDVSGLMPAARDAHITLLLDVNNPLTGKNGAAHVFGPQKGATPDMVLALDAGIAALCALARAQLNLDMDAHPGAGAAGGLGGALSAFLGAKMRSGIDTLLNLMQFDEGLMDCDLVITGEGRVDGQSLQGKAVSGIARRANALGVPVVALAGGLGSGAEALRISGVLELFPIAEGPLSLEESMREGERLLRAAAQRLFGVIAIGQRLAGK